MWLYLSTVVLPQEVPYLLVVDLEERDLHLVLPALGLQLALVLAHLPATSPTTPTHRARRGETWSRTRGEKQTLTRNQIHTTTTKKKTHTHTTSPYRVEPPWLIDYLDWVREHEQYGRYNTAAKKTDANKKSNTTKNA